jgi:predicted DNA-binding WGR domain protein
VIDHYVVVTIADNGVVHAWGKGHIFEQVETFPNRAAAQTAVKRAKKQDAERYVEGRVTYKVCKLLASEPSTSEFRTLTEESV